MHILGCVCSNLLLLPNRLVNRVNENGWDQQNEKDDRVEKERPIPVHLNGTLVASSEFLCHEGAYSVGKADSNGQGSDTDCQSTEAQACQRSLIRTVAQNDVVCDAIDRVEKGSHDDEGGHFR